MMRNLKPKKVCLIHSPLEDSAYKTTLIKSLAPLNLISLATYLSNNFQDLDIKIINGELLGLEKTIEESNNFSADIVGIGVQSCESYSTAVQIAEKVKTDNNKIIIGGKHVSSIANQILKNRTYINYVIKGDGELSLKCILEGIPFQNIPNLVYRDKNNNIIMNREKNLSLREIPIPNRCLISQEEYSKNFQDTLESKITGFKSMALARTQKGCIKAIRHGVCTFCIRDDILKVDFKSPDRFWEEMSYLESLGVDHVWDVSPSFTGASIKYLSSLVSKKPKSSKIRYRIYGNATELLDENKVDLLNKLGVENILIGFESGNQRCLDLSNKHASLYQHLEATKNLKKYGIAVCASFILGHLGETKKSLKDTLNHIKELKDILGEKLFRSVTCSKMQLYPGSVEWNIYCNTFPHLMNKYAERDIIPLQEISKQYIQNYLHLDVGELEEIIKKIRAIPLIGVGKDKI